MSVTERGARQGRGAQAGEPGAQDRGPAQAPAQAAAQALALAPFPVVILHPGEGEERLAWLNEAAGGCFGPEARPGLARTALPGPLAEALFDPPEELRWGEGEAARWLQVRRRPLPAGGRAHYYLDVSEQRTLRAERARLQDELAQHVTRDALTGLPNRRALLENLETLVTRSRRYGNPFSVIRLRLENLEEVERGHGTGSRDRVLVAVAHILRDKLRWADQVGRFDREEFLLVLPETDGPSARQLLRMLRRRLRSLAERGLDGRPFALQARFGLAAWGQGDDARLLLRRAEEGMRP